nr:hypothetical protein [uncultured Flavobacterium sp.]
MKQIIIIVFLVLISCDQVKYQSLKAKETDIENLLKHINPNKDYDYWEINFSLAISSNVIFFKGNKELKQKYNYKQNHFGFFSGCQPMTCNYNIIYLENGKWNYILSEAELATFINKIDNPEEAFLITRINKYNIDSNNQKGNGFVKTKNGYDLKVMKYISCPESKESFVVSIDSTGKLIKSESQGFYLKTKDCIVY